MPSVGLFDCSMARRRISISTPVVFPEPMGPMMKRMNAADVMNRPTVAGAV
jgi:hypothetical protein